MINIEHIETRFEILFSYSDSQKYNQFLNKLSKLIPAFTINRGIGCWNNNREISVALILDVSQKDVIITNKLVKEIAELIKIELGQECVKLNKFLLKSEMI